MIYASWSRRRRRNRQESLGSPARKRKGGLDQPWWMESGRPMRRKTRKKMANRSERWGLWVLPVERCQGNRTVSIVLGARARGLCIGWGTSKLLGSVVEGGRGPLIKVVGEMGILMTVSTCRLKMAVLVMTKLRNLRVMGTRKRRKKTLKKKPKR